MISGKKKLVLEKEFPEAAISDSKRITGATVLDYRKPLSLENIRRLSTYVTIILITEDRKTVWVA